MVRQTFSIPSDGIVGPLTAPLCGTATVPGDKSISHRALMLAAAAEGTSVIAGIPDADDIGSTLLVLSQLGAEISIEAAKDESMDAIVTGWGAKGPLPLSEESVLDCGNSGTTARLLMGLLAPWPLRASISGDESLRRRPMSRVAEPLKDFGAYYGLTDGCLPAKKETSHDGGFLHGANIVSDSPSAQVKTAIILTAMAADGISELRFPCTSRDHTERMLGSFGVSLSLGENGFMALPGPQVPKATKLTVPGDPSSAAPLICAALLKPGSCLTVEDLCLNPTRTAFMEVLSSMGAHIQVSVQNSISDTGPFASANPEPVGSVIIKGSEGPLKAVEIPAGTIPSLVDEIPVLAVAMAHADGVSVIRGAGELRHKESDRLTGIAEGLARFGIEVEIVDDDLFITGDPDSLACRSASVVLNSNGDHRMAMAWSLMGACGSAPVMVEGLPCIRVSYPAFIQELQRLAK